MKEIKAYVRVHMVDKVIRGLEEAGFSDMTVIDVRSIRQAPREKDLDYAVELADRYMNVAKLAMVVRDQDVEVVTRTICARARTGAAADGLIYVTPVEDAIHVRTGTRGESAVESPHE